ncbi:MAG: hypothetical protein AAFZ09_07550 [Pseudomonadota bacterium]
MTTTFRPARPVLAGVVGLLLAGPAVAGDFFQPRTLGAKDSARVQRAIASAYATGSAVQNQDQVVNGNGGGVVCRQGTVEQDQEASPFGPPQENVIVVEDSVNVCFGR